MTNEPIFLAKLADASTPTVSFEFFPPKTAAGFDSLRLSFAQLLKLSPDFVSVTFGAMGANQETSFAVVEEMASQVPTIAHLTCIGATQGNLEELLSRYEEVGVAGVLALRGDVPAQFEGNPLGDFQHADQLLALAKAKSHLSVGVAAFPEGHPESKNFATDIQVLSRKQQLGAELAITQLFFDIDAYFALVENASMAGVNFPIVPGLMPIGNAKQVLRMAEMSGARIPDSLLGKLKNSSSDSEAREIGMEFSIQLGRELIAGGAPGLHVFTLNQHEAATELLDGIGVI